jgi:chorismate dehydratase
MNAGGTPHFSFLVDPRMTLTVGRISYVNIIPFFHHLSRTGFGGSVVDGVPSDLNARLSAGELDLSPSSSFEYALHWRDYLLLPGLSISSRGPAHSVLLFSRRPLEEVAGEAVAVSGESATSINLCKVLLKEFCGAGEVNCRVPDTPVEEIIAAGGSALLIGDRALRAVRTLPTGVHSYDLGELWYRFTGLPFVFALWIVRRQAFAEHAQAIQAFRCQLEQALTLAFADLPGMAAAVAPGAPLSIDELIVYWRDSMSYDLTAAHLAGLRLFYALCCKHGLLAEEPELRFVD